MTPFYWETAHGNFGDDLNLWLWDFLLPGFREIRPDVLLVGVGTVLNRELLPREGRKLVVGSGFGYGTPAEIDPQLWDIRCVRGPATAKALGLDRSLGIIDPAVMLTEMPEFRTLKKNDRQIFVPHWESTHGGIWDEVSKVAGLTYVDPRGEAKAVVRQIAEASLVIAESMHAAIIADAFRVPWVAVTTSSSINRFKWSDWSETVGVTYDPVQVPISSRAEAVTKGAKFWGRDYARAAASLSEAARPDPAADEKRHASIFRRLAKLGLAGPSVLALRRAKAARPQLSADGVLQERKDRFSAVIAGIRRDYF